MIHRNDGTYGLSVQIRYQFFEEVPLQKLKLANDTATVWCLSPLHSCWYIHHDMVELKAKGLIRDIPDFPEKGIVFKDITPVLQDPAAFEEALAAMEIFASRQSPTVIAGIESRGFIFGAPLAHRLKLPFVLIRKLGKLPADTISEEYQLEYGTSTVEVHRDAATEGDRVLIVDDLLATGGTALAAAKLIEKLGADVVGFAFLVELDFLNGREKLIGYELSTLIKY
jgi:adenine phosphoribosyltransferase